MKEESTPYTGADSLKQIVFFLRFNLPDFNLQNYLLVRVHKNILLLLYGDFKRGLYLLCRIATTKVGKIRLTAKLFGRNLADSSHFLPFLDRKTCCFDRKTRRQVVGLEDKKTGYWTCTSCLLHVFLSSMQILSKR